MNLLVFGMAFLCIAISVVFLILYRKELTKKRILTNENKLLTSRVESLEEKTATKIQIFARLSQLLASSFKREAIFKQILTEFTRYFPDYKLCAILKTEEDESLVIDEESDSHGRICSDVDFSNIVQVFSNMQEHGGAKIAYSVLDGVLLQQNLGNYIYPFALLTEEKVQGYLVVSLPSPIMPDEHLFFTDSATLMSSALQNVITTNERNFINDQFGRSVDEKVRDYLLTHKDGGSIQHVSVMFFDIRNFTTLSEKLGPSRSVALLNAIFSRCDKIIRNQNGFINKFTGDGFMAVFGAPIPTKIHQLQAIKAALEILKGMKLPCGIGIASGEAVAGTIGSSQRKEYTVIGDTVNTSSRVEGLCKVFGSCLVVTEKTFAPYKKFLEQKSLQAKNRFLGKIRLKGKAEPVNVYDLLSKDACYSKEFNEAVDLYYKKDFLAANKIFTELKKEFANDKAIAWYISKCNKRIASTEEWDGIEQMTEK